jgi:hypothetical protein
MLVLIKQVEPGVKSMESRQNEAIELATSRKLKCPVSLATAKLPSMGGLVFLLPETLLNCRLSFY